MTDEATRTWNDRVFNQPGWEWTRWMRLIDWLGFCRQTDYVLAEDLGRATWDIPTWARSPGADIIGVWNPVRSRLLWGWLPLTPWRPVRRRVPLR